MHKDGWVVPGYNGSERSACECCITMLVDILGEAVEEGAVAGPEDSSVYYGGRFLPTFHCRQQNAVCGIISWNFPVTNASV